MQAFRYEAVFEMIKSGKVQPAKMLGRTISLEEAPEVLINMDKFEHLGVTVINKF